MIQSGIRIKMIINGIKSFLNTTVFIFLMAGFVACKTSMEEEFSYDQFYEEGEEFGGGIATQFDESENAFGNLPSVLIARNREFVVGNSFFRRNWVTEPSSTSSLDGLGPLFNARSCGNCHTRDGRGAPPLTPDEEPIALLFKLRKSSGIQWEQLPDPVYGDQFNPFSILSLTAEGSVSVAYEEQAGTYPDGSTYSLRKPVNTFSNLNYGPFDAAVKISPRIAPHLIGLGLLEAIAEEDILANSDEFDSDQDGISGRANYVWDIVSDQEVIGRFGWKANQPNVKQQVAAAFVGDIGITSSLFPDESCGDSQQACEDAIFVDDIELSEDLLDQVSFYAQALAIPRRRDWEAEEVLKGKNLFNTIQCGACHTPKFITGSFDDIPEYEGQTIRPYTDLLLHDMGEGLADGAEHFRASGSEWRTPPLWGLGMVSVVNDHTFLLHDGRARNFEEAILWHGGEAEESKQSFMALEKEEREAIIAFLNSL